MSRRVVRLNRYGEEVIENVPASRDNRRDYYHYDNPDNQGRPHYRADPDRDLRRPTTGDTLSKILDFGARTFNGLPRPAQDQISRTVGGVTRDIAGREPERAVYTRLGYGREGPGPGPAAFSDTYSTQPRPQRFQPRRSHTAHEGYPQPRSRAPHPPPLRSYVPQARYEPPGSAPRSCYPPPRPRAAPQSSSYPPRSSHGSGERAVPRGYYEGQDGLLYPEVERPPWGGA